MRSLIVNPHTLAVHFVLLVMLACAFDDFGFHFYAFPVFVMRILPSPDRTLCEIPPAVHYTESGMPLS